MTEDPTRTPNPCGVGAGLKPRITFPSGGGEGVKIQFINSQINFKF